MTAERVVHQTVFGRLIGRFALIEKHEMAAVIASFLLFFFVLGGYFCVRPVRETVGTILGRDRVADLYLWTSVGSILVIPIFGWLVARLKRSVFLPLIYGFVAVSLAVIGILLRANEGSIAVGQFFYVFISILSLCLTSVFWAFCLELFDSGQAKRLFGVIAAGGTAGALAGPGITFLTVSRLGNSGVLFVGAAMFVVAILCQQALLRIWKGRSEAPQEDRPIGGNPFAGFLLVLRSPYLLAIALFVVLLAAANTFLYFEQLRLVKATFADAQERTKVFAALDWTVQALTILCQLFLTGRIASRLGLGVLLAVVPVIMIFGFLSLAAVGTFAVLAVVFVLRRVGEYAFVRPGREILFSRVDNETKYKAKNVIDVPVYRGSDAITAQVSTALEGGALGTSAVALIGAIVATVWAVNGWWLGKRSDARES
ncbi:MAG TPA: MFS transporter [Chthoniobacterales bacterium]|nr:MFS transporter [Chthoniobacterales bacterium]